jgi:predicted nucleotidyltransferase
VQAACPYAGAFDEDGRVLDGADWLSALPEELAGQKRLLSALVRWCRQDPDACWLVVGCSLVRGNADSMSDLDMAVGVTDGQVEQVARRLSGAAGEFGDLVECFDHRLAALALPHRRVFAQYADRTQIDLVVGDASNSNVPGVMVLYDPHGVITGRSGPAELTGPARTWACLAWEALANLGKYLRRRSPWEAHDRLEAARAHIWQLWALAEMVPEPQFGVTSVLDANGPPSFPVGIESTLAGIDLVEIFEAAVRLATVLTDLQDRLVRTGMFHMPEALGRYVANDLKRFVLCSEEVAERSPVDGRQ